MSRKFSVGQRVRVVLSDDMPEYVGTQTVITEVMGLPMHPAGPFAKETWYCTDLRFSDGEGACYPSSALEPVYDGTEKVSWSTCLWQPKAVRA